jgi:oligopeptide/dipeptide ABC transporter ATP-binding protein
MYLGKVVELADTAELFGSPRHPYTAALLSASMVADPEKARSSHRVVLYGDVPSPINPPPGCRFHTRCPKAQSICSVEEPPLRVQAGDSAGHVTACHFPVAPGEQLVGAAPAISAAATAFAADSPNIGEGGRA